MDTPAGTYTLETEWLVAADGGRSGIRSSMGLQMEGASYEGLFVIADIRSTCRCRPSGWPIFDPHWNPGNTILMHREPLGIWRIDYQLPRGETPEQALQPESLQAAHRRPARDDRPRRHALGDWTGAPCTPRAR